MTIPIPISERKMARRFADAVADRLAQHLKITNRLVFTASEAARVVGCRSSKILEAIKGGNLAAHRCDTGGAWRIQRDDLITWATRPSVSGDRS
jgi:excisionase family DNA binding protein